MRVDGDGALRLWKAMSGTVEDGEELEERRRNLFLPLLYIGAGQ